MSISKRGRRPRAGVRSAASSALPATVSRRALLDAGSDRRFRTLLHDLFTVSARMELVREHLGLRLGISGPQYTVLAAVAHLQGEQGTSVSAVAKTLHVSSAFVATESGKLAQRGLLDKRTNPRDRRGVLLSLSRAGRSEIRRIGAELRSINDAFFGSLDAKAFAALSAAAGALVGGSRKAVQLVGGADSDAGSALEAAE
jgi:MarR family transcriptional regulator, organic hydroperoxide resistance regulator